MAKATPVSSRDNRYADMIFICLFKERKMMIESLMKIIEKTKGKEPRISIKKQEESKLW